MDYPNSDPSIGLVDGVFVDENLVTGKAGSIIPAAWANGLMSELLGIIEEAGLTPSEIDNTQLLQSMQSLFAARSSSIPIVATRPLTNVGANVIYVADQMTIMNWVTTAYYSGYRSPLCGKLDFGWTPTPLPWQVEAIGGTLNETAHGGLIGRFRESGLVVALGSWVAGEYKIADLGGGNWKAPDVRNQFLRFTGTDLDTANARTLASKQIDMFKSHSHTITPSAYSAAAWNGGVTYGNYDVSSLQGTHTGLTGGAETRPANTAFIPVICI